MTTNILTASCDSVLSRSIKWSTFPAIYRRTPSKRRWTTSLVLTIFSFRRIANRLWARNGEDGGLCGGLFHRDGKKALISTKLGISNHQRVKGARITLLPVHRRQTPRRTLRLSRKAILQLGGCERRLFCRRHHFNPAGVFFTP